MSGPYKKEAETRPRDRTVVVPAVQIEVGRLFQDMVGIEVPVISVSIADVDYD